MTNATFTIAERPNGSKGQFLPIPGLPLMTLTQARAVWDAKQTASDGFEYVVINTQAQ